MAKPWPERPVSAANKSGKLEVTQWHGSSIRAGSEVAMLQCVRGMCTETATAGLGYDVPGTRAWLYDLDAATIAGTSRQRDMIMPLCRAHADRIKVPVGWVLDDQRAPAPEPVVAQPEPSTVAADGAEPLFRPRSRPEPAEMSQPEPEREPAAPSLLERAFRAAPSR